MTRDYNDGDLKDLSKNTKQIIIQRAREIPITYSVRTKTSSRKKLKNYLKRKEDRIQFKRLRGLPENKILSMIRKYWVREGYDKIIINTTNMGDVDILDYFIIHYKCNIPTDDDKLARQDEFKKEVKDIVQEHTSFYQNYQTPS